MPPVLVEKAETNKKFRLGFFVGAHFNFKLKLNQMKTVTMLEFRKNAKAILRRIGHGERFLLSHRGRPAARLEPIKPTTPPDPATDPFLTMARRALPSPKGKTNHADIDRILYGRP